MPFYLVIGGPKHGEIVDWPMRNESDYYAIPVQGYNLLENSVETRREYYRPHRMSFFGYGVIIWLHERLSRTDEKELAKRLLPEILSYKGFYLMDSSISFAQDILPKDSNGS